MKNYLLLCLLFLAGCSCAQKNGPQVENQLLNDVKTLSSDQYEGRKTGTRGASLAREYISGRFKEIGLKAFGSTYAQTFSFSEGNEPVTGTNLVGYIQGQTDEVIVISAHYDHLGIVNNEIYNGADDNASGVAALLQFAKYFSGTKPVKTLVFAAFDAEEMGLRGAKAFVANPPVAIGQILLNINMDMISHNDNNELYVCGTFKYPELKQFINPGNVPVKVIPGHDDPGQGHDDWTNQSDQGAFNEKDIPFLYFGVEDHKDYHKPADDYENINKVFLARAADAIQNIISNIDKGLKTR